MSNESREFDVRNSVYRAWCEALSLDPREFDPSLGFVESGGYSLVALRLIDKLNSLFEIELDFSLFLGRASADSLVRHVLELRLERANAIGGRGAVREEGFI